MIHNETFIKATTDRCIEDTLDFTLPRLHELAQRYQWSADEYADIARMVTAVLDEHGRNIKQAIEDLAIAVLR